MSGDHRGSSGVGATPVSGTEAVGGGCGGNEYCEELIEGTEAVDGGVAEMYMGAGISGVVFGGITRGSSLLTDDLVTLTLRVRSPELPSDSCWLSGELLGVITSGCTGLLDLL